MNKKETLAGRFGTKSIVTIIACVLVLCCVIGGTVAWLIDETPPVVNTFTYGDINIQLDESDTGDDDEDPNTNTYDMLPGNVIAKDPKVTVIKGSEDCWVFVKLEKSDNFDDFMSYEIAEGWTELEEGVYYREYAKNEDADTEYFVLKDNQVLVNGDVTKEQLNALNADGEQNYPTLTVTAYAVQADAELDAIDSAVDAWALIADQNTSSDDGAEA